MKKFYLSMAAIAMAIGTFAQSVTASWSLSDPENLQQVTVSGDLNAASFLTTGVEQGSKLVTARVLSESGASTGYEPATYDPAFTAFTPELKVSGPTEGHCVSFTITPQQGHTYKPLSLSFDAVKVGTDGGNVEVRYRIGDGEEQTLAPNLTLIRNRVSASVPVPYSSFDFKFGDVITDGQPLTVVFYLYNIQGANVSSPKEIGLRQIKLSGAVDEPIFTASTFVKSMTITAAEEVDKPKKIDLTDLVANLKNGQTVAYKNTLYSVPADVTFSLAEGCSASTSYKSNTLTTDIVKDNETILSFSVRFHVTIRGTKPAAKPLNRGLMALSLTGAKMGTGNLVSWRHRASDDYGVKYKLYRGDAASQDILLNDGLYIIDRTNFVDVDGTADDYYLLETYDKFGTLLESEVSRKTWDNQTITIPTEAPVDQYFGASYTPNDASYCDMDGDGEYEIILKWSPSNEKDAASSGNTSPAIFDCLKLDGTRLWRIDAGPNFFTSAHTMQFIAWDFDGDGYGEFMMKTAPGTIDGEGNYVLLGDDDPNENLLSSRGKQDHGSEYITVFEGLTGRELATIPYHTDYQAGLSVWGDSNQNRSERYLAALAYLDGPDANPSPIFSRGYYAGAFVGAYDWDGTTLKERWVSRNTVKNEGLWGEGAHWISVGDCDGDGHQEIIFGSAALDHDGSLLYRTGLGHGDALHLGDFLPERPGMEVFMVHEETPYGYDLRDAATGKLLLYKTADSDTGRGLAAHFDSSSPHSQFLYSASAGVHDCLTGEMIAEKWQIGSSGAGINNRIYWNGDLYDEFFDKSIIAHWNHENSWFDRYQVNAGNYVYGKLNNSSKYNPCVLGDLLGDWREEIVTWDESTKHLIINATSFPTDYRLPHLMDDLNYRVQVVNQNCCYNQPPHLSFDPSVKYAGNPNVAQQEDLLPSGIDDIATDNVQGPDVIYTIQGMRVSKITTPGLYIVNGKKVLVP